jgi:hypothetical protein
MQKLFRSLIAIGGLAGLAACGDDVSVTGPTLTISGAPVTAVQVGAHVQLSATEAVNWTSSAASVATVDATGLVTAVGAGTASITATATADVNRKASVTITVTAPAVRSVTVTPANAILNAGQSPAATQGFIANVDADAGVARTVTWTSSNPAVATINATTGLATAVGVGSTTITAASTVAASVTGAALLQVRQPTPATISIQNFTVTGSAGNTVNVNNVVGSIDVNMNVDPGEQIVQRAEVLIDGNVACSQNLSGAQSEALRLAAAFEELEAVIVSCQVNTALFNTTTGIAAFLNGPHTVSARAIIAGGTQTATPSTQLVFNNTSTYLATLTLGGTTAQATGSDGLGYRRGSLTVTVLPVIYTAGGVTMAAGTVTFGSAACDASPTNSARTATLTAGTATFSQTAAAGVGNVTDYEYERGTCTAPETVILNATDSQGNPLFTASPPSALSTPGIRLDNRAPAAPVVFENAGQRAGGWVNDAVSFVTVQNGTTNPNGMISAAVTDAGVNTVTYAAKAAVTTSVATAAGTADITNPSTLALSLANQVCVVFFAQDALGNRSSSGGNVTCDTGDADQNTLVGVDRAAPIVTYDAGSLAANARSNTASIGGEFVLAVVDTGTAGIGVSGAIPSRATVTRRDSVNAAVCQFGTIVSSVCTAAAMAQTGVGIFATTITAETRSGYFTFTGTGFDAAGNSTPAPSTRVAVHDAVGAPSLALSPAQVSLANNFYNGGVAQTFSSFANDNFDVWKVDYQFTYPGLPADIFYGTGLINGFNATPLLNTNVPSAFTVPFFYRQMQVAGALACPAAVTVSAVQKPTAIVGTLFDQGGNTVTTPTAIGANTVVTGSATAYPGTMCAWTDSVSATTIGDGTVSPGTTPTTVTVFANALGPTLAFNPVFARVDFYYVSGGRMILIGTAFTPATIDPNPQGVRQHRYSIPWTPGTAFVSGGTIVAIGSTANGDALASPASGIITIQP